MVSFFDFRVTSAPITVCPLSSLTIPLTSRETNGGGRGAGVRRRLCGRPADLGKKLAWYAWSIQLLWVVFSWCNGYRYWGILFLAKVYFPQKSVGLVKIRIFILFLSHRRWARYCRRRLHHVRRPPPPASTRPPPPPPPANPPPPALPAATRVTTAPPAPPAPPPFLLSAARVAAISSTAARVTGNSLGHLQAINFQVITRILLENW